MTSLPRPHAVVEGISEYRLPNGLRVLLFPDPSTATVTVNITAHPFITAGTNYNVGDGGGFRSNFVVDFSATETATLNDWLVWCIDPTRSVGIPSTNNYQLFSLAGFAASGNTTSGHVATVPQLTQIAFYTSELEDDWGSLTATDRANRQGGTWDQFTNTNTSGYNVAAPMAFDASNWYVLRNGQTQTLLTRIPAPNIVPEPSTIALMVQSAGRWAASIRAASPAAASIPLPFKASRRADRQSSYAVTAISARIWRACCASNAMLRPPVSATT
jgi:hypothetical protein